MIWHNIWEYHLHSYQKLKTGGLSRQLHGAIRSDHIMSTQQKEELEKCITEAREKNIINLDSMDRDEKDMVFAFARKLDSMDEKDKAKWKELLNLM